MGGALPGPWVPVFKGIDHAVGTNKPGIAGNFPRLQVAHCIRVDLTDPDVRLLSTPPAPGYDVESRETLTQTVPNFLRKNHLQVACDANYYSANPGGADPTSEGVSCDVFGLQISAGTVVSPQTTADIGGDPRYAALFFTTNNQPGFNFVNRPPGIDTAGLYTAVTGYYPIVSNGVNIGAATISSYPDNSIHQVQPRTAFGLSQDNRYLLLMTIDGRQSGYSDGALDTETAYWMLQFGGWNAINMDGGGSTSMYLADSLGQPVAVNHSSYRAAYGHERYVGSHFGVEAKPLPGFINDVTATPDDTVATITWKTTAPATSQVQFGETPDMPLLSPAQSESVTNHTVVLSGLTPATTYYFQALSTAGGSQYASSNFVFLTTNYVTTMPVFDLTNEWRYATANLDGVPWTSPDYDDSGWDGSGAGLLWVDTRITGPNPNVQPRNTQMPADPNNNGYPYITYYFRTHFQHASALAGATLDFTTYLDDGAVLYLNGVEVYRLHMDPAPAPIANDTLATGYECASGDATCPIAFSISGDAATNLVAGDNVLAVEVHNYNARSPDITFGAALSITEPLVISPALQIEATSGAVTLAWTRSGFVLQQAADPAGPWVDLPGPVVTSPYTAIATGQAQFFRLRK